MNNRAIKLYIKNGTNLAILFLDGTTREYNVLDLANKYPQLNELKDRKLFKSGKLFGWGGVIWNDELDLDADVVYEDGKIIQSEEKACEIIVGYQIKQARLQRELTQKELSEIVDIDQADLSKIENGKMCPSLSTLKKIARGLKTQINMLIM